MMYCLVAADEGNCKLAESSTGGKVHIITRQRKDYNILRCSPKKIYFDLLHIINCLNH